MPKVAGKSFPYTPKGKAQAASFAKKTGAKMERPPKSGMMKKSMPKEMPMKMPKGK